MKIPAFFYHPDGFETSRPNLMGRHAAGEEFFKAICRYSGDETLYSYAYNQKHFEHFVQKAKAYSEKDRKLAWISWTNWSKLAEPGCIFTPGPVLHELAWQRRFSNQRLFSICGITHTTATSRVMDCIGELLSSPVQPWDALICTSECVRNTVRRVVADQYEYLRERFGTGIQPPASIQLPVIPLGVDAQTYDVSEDTRSAHRKKWRQALKIDDAEFVILYFGRLSFVGKAHPMAMYIAAEEAAKKSTKKIHLILAGWFESDKMKEHFIETAKALCPSLRVSFIDGRKPEVRAELWYAADIFTSLSDNIQETFGLTPVEAMACGLPVVISDWNGYKETVDDQREGFLIPTWMPPPGLGEELALAHAMGLASYDQYIGYQCQFTSVDIQACSEAYLKLSEDDALVREMGAAGKEKARRVYDWPVIIKQYEQLWDNLEKIRKIAPEAVARRNGQAAYPLRNDPNIVFSSYPTHVLKRDTAIHPINSTDSDRLKKLLAIPMGRYATEFLHNDDDTVKLLEQLSTMETATIDSLTSELASHEKKSLILTVMWLTKMGLLGLTNPSGNEKPDPELLKATSAIFEQISPNL